MCVEMGPCIAISLEAQCPCEALRLLASFRHWPSLQDVYTQLR